MRKELEKRLDKTNQDFAKVCARYFNFVHNAEGDMCETLSYCGKYFYFMDKTFKRIEIEHKIANWDKLIHKEIG